MQVFLNKDFYQWAEDLGLDDIVLRRVIEEVADYHYEANLGGNLYKKRIALNNRGKSSGARTILAFKRDDKAFFIYGFSKGKRANISEKELKALKELAKVYFSLTNAQIKRALCAKEFIEIM